MIKNYISYLAGLLAACICLLNFEVNAGIKKKDFKSKTVSELIDVLKNDELLEKKIMEKIDKQLMCKLQLYSFSNELDRFKEDLKSSYKSMSNVPKALQK